MHEVTGCPTGTIPQDVLLARLAQSDQMREFFIQMWLQNPLLSKCAGQRVNDILSPATVPPAPTIPESISMRATQQELHTRNEPIFEIAKTQGVRL